MHGHAATTTHTHTHAISLMQTCYYLHNQQTHMSTMMYCRFVNPRQKLVAQSAVFTVLRYANAG